MRTWVATIRCVSGGWVVTATKPCQTRADARREVAAGKSELRLRGADDVTGQVAKEGS